MSLWRYTVNVDSCIRKGIVALRGVKSGKEYMYPHPGIPGIDGKGSCYGSVYIVNTWNTIVGYINMV